MVATTAMQYTETLNASELDMTPVSPSLIEPKPNYFSIWMATCRVFFRHIGPMLGFTLLVSAPFFLVNALIHAHHMMTLGGAALSQVEIPMEQMRVLWLSLVCGDALAFIALSLSTLLMAKYLFAEPRTSIGAVLAQTLRSIWFWISAIVQIISFIMVNSPDGGLKIGGMILYAVSILFFLASQDNSAPAYGRRLQQLRWTGWLSLVLVLLTFPALFVLLNGFTDYIMLMFMDKGAAHLLDLFAPGSPVLPYGTITLSKFLSQWLNLVPMTMLLCAYLSLRGTSTSTK